MNDYQRIEHVIRYLDDHRSEQPNLAVLANQVRLSPFHFHRLFTRWAGITPKEFLQCLTLAHARRMLQSGQDVLTTALDVGLSGPSRLHDLCVQLQAASPGELKVGGADWIIQAGFADSPFGTCLIGESPRGICHLSFVETEDRSAGVSAIGRDWPRARVEWNDTNARRLITAIFLRPVDSASPAPLRAFVRGSQFQVQVWRALLNVPAGSLVSYGRLAAWIGHPSAARAVGTAVGQNPIAFLIPCHRAIRETGMFGEYHWGTARKKAMVAWESSAHTTRSCAESASLR
jgi:AraC family transcriptional regulator of adaptative response/methylated-DNA-[protein]-cysteine methyltransferase